jgi:hypothetical protein
VSPKAKKPSLTESQLIDRLRARYGEKSGNGNAYAFIPGVRSAAARVRYTLISEPGVHDGRGGVSERGLRSLSPATDPVAPTAVVNTGTLFDPEPEAPRNPYEYESEAA